MRPSDPTAVSKRFAAVLARGLARADMEISEHFARIRALPSDDTPPDTSPWFKGLPSAPEPPEADDAWLDDEVHANEESAPAAVSDIRVARRVSRRSTTSAARSRRAD